MARWRSRFCNDLSGAPDKPIHHADDVLTRTVNCETTGKIRYKRWLARCSVGGDDIALWLAEGGWVFPYRDCKCEIFRGAVDRAKAAQFGIWSGDVQEPWEWRKAN